MGVLNVSYLAVGEVRYFGSRVDEASRVQWGRRKYPMDRAMQITNDDNAKFLEIYGQKCAYCLHSGLLALEDTGRVFYCADLCMDRFDGNGSWQLLGELWWQLFPQVAGLAFQDAIATLAGTQPSIQSVFFHADGYLYQNAILSEGSTMKRRTSRMARASFGVTSWWCVPFAAFTEVQPTRTRAMSMK